MMSKCTILCGVNQYTDRSCNKTFLVDVHLSDDPTKTARVYAILDDQSNRSLVSPELLDTLDIDGESTPYTLSSCSGNINMCGRRVHGLVVTSIDGNSTFDLPTLIECDDIPNDLSEVPTPEVARQHPHLDRIASSIPPLHPDTKIQLVIGRDLPEARHIIRQIVGPSGTPFAHMMAFGWAIIGEVCLGRVHRPETTVTVNKISVLQDGRRTCFQPCQNHLELKEQAPSAADYCHDNVFRTTPEDNQVGLSVEDRRFLELMDQEFQMVNGRWTAPLSFFGLFQKICQTTECKPTTEHGFFMTAYSAIKSSKNILLHL